MKILIQKPCDVAACPDEKGPAQADKPHVLGKEIKADGEKGIDPGRAENPLPVNVQDQGKQEEPQDQELALGVEKVTHLRPGGERHRGPRCVTLMLLSSLFFRFALSAKLRLSLPVLSAFREGRKA